MGLKRNRDNWRKRDERRQSRSPNPEKEPADGRRHDKTEAGLEPHQIILRPLVTEKGMHKANRCNAYAFEVNRMAGKDDVRRAIEELFDVKVVGVQTQNRQGKPRRSRYTPGDDQGLEKGHRHAWTPSTGSTSSKLVPDR